MTSTENSVQTRQREQWVDALRVVLISGIIVVHTATAHVTDFAGYYYHDDERVTNSGVPIALALPALMGEIFGLGPLFVVAGGSRSGRWRDACRLASWAATCCGSAYRWCSSYSS